MSDEKLLRDILKNVASMGSDVSTLKEDVRDIKRDMKNQYVTKELLSAELGKIYARFNPSRTLIFSMVGIILLSFLGAVTAFFIR